MFERILFPTDFSAISQEAAAAIPNIPEVKEVHVLHIVEDKGSAEPRDVHPGFGPSHKETVERRRQAATERAAQLADQLTAAGLTATYAVEGGKAAETIIRTAKEKGVNAIVMGASGKAAVAKTFVGSVSDKVIQMANTPVLVIKPTREWSATRTEPYGSSS